MTEENQPSDSLITEQQPALDFSTGKPEGFPDDFWDVEKNTPATDKLYKSWESEKKRAEGLRVKLSKGEFEGKAPEDIKEYVLELSDELKPLVSDDDPVFNAARQAAKDAGLPKEAFSKFMLPVISELARIKAEADAPMSEADIEAARTVEIEKLGPSGGKIVEVVGSFIKQLEAGGTFSESEAQAARNMANNADAVRVLNKLRMMAGDSKQVPVEMPIDARASRMDIETKMADAMLKGDEASYLKFSGMLSKMNN